MNTLINNLRTEDQATMLGLDAEIMQMEEAKIILEREILDLKDSIDDAETNQVEIVARITNDVYYGPNAGDYSNESKRKARIKELLEADGNYSQWADTIKVAKKTIVRKELDVKLANKRIQSVQRKFDLGIALIRNRR
jgi:hypothetical protein